MAARGKAKTLAMNHKSSRVLQSILKWGTDEQKAGLVDEILPNLVGDPSRSSLRSGALPGRSGGSPPLFAHRLRPVPFLPAAAPRWSSRRTPTAPTSPGRSSTPPESPSCPTSSRPSRRARHPPTSPPPTLPSSPSTHSPPPPRCPPRPPRSPPLPQGHCVQLARHPHGAPVLDALYVKLPSSKRASVLSEFYGREFQLLLLQERSAGAPPPRGRSPRRVCGEEGARGLTPAAAPLLRLLRAPPPRRPAEAEAPRAEPRRRGGPGPAQEAPHPPARRDHHRPGAPRPLPAFPPPPRPSPNQQLGAAAGPAR